MTQPRAALLAELVGTFLLVLFGTGAVASAVLTGAQVGLWQVAVVWGIGVALAIYATAAISGAHLNPAVSLAFAVLRPTEFPRHRLAGYWAAQLAGGVLAGLVVLGVFAPFIARFEAEHGIERGAEGSEASAMVFGEYFPNPAIFGTSAEARSLVSPALAFGVEAVGTALLVFLIFALTDSRNTTGPGVVGPLMIGLLVAVLISVFAPITQAGRSAFQPGASWRKFSRKPKASLLKPSSTPSFTTMVLIAPMRRAASSQRSTRPIAASLCGTVRLTPANPIQTSALSAPERCSGRTGRGT